jgi:hypothetical protein
MVKDLAGLAEPARKTGGDDETVALIARKRLQVETAAELDALLPRPSRPRLQRRTLMINVDSPGCLWRYSLRPTAGAFAHQSVVQNALIVHAGAFA